VLIGARDPHRSRAGAVPDVINFFEFWAFFDQFGFLQNRKGTF
jgi:hypothetical protein